MAKDDKRRRQEKRCDGHILVEADVERKGHMAGGEWMMRPWKEDHADQRGRGGWMTHGSRRKAGLEGDMTGEGPTLAKHRAAENDEDPSAVDPGAKISAVEKLRAQFRTPPPLRLKVERQGGSGIAFIVVDPGY
jgi:hypothetical protein